jgi:GDP-mannose 6-dehydrogenase
VKVGVFDPEKYMSRLIGANRRYIEGTIPRIAPLMSSDLEEAIESPDALIAGINPDDPTNRLRGIVRRDQFRLDLVNLDAKEYLRC